MSSFTDQGDLPDFWSQNIPRQNAMSHVSDWKAEEKRDPEQNTTSLDDRLLGETPYYWSPPEISSLLSPPIPPSPPPSSRRFAASSSSSTAIDTSPLLQYPQTDYSLPSLSSKLDREAPSSIWVKISEGLFDIFTVLVFTADVTLDVLITIQFYELKQLTFFYTSIALFFCSQVAYSTLFVLIFAGGCRKRGRYLAFICIFPFAQFVPYIVFAHSFHWGWMDRIIHKLGLDLVPVNEYDPEKDPLKQFVQDKIHQHGGFMTEALVEALPQSILQVIALVVLNDVTSFLAISSVVMSMISLASRGVILSYSLDGWTRLFNIWGFVLDVFSLFTTVLWLFFTVSGQTVVPVWPGVWEQEVSIVSVWWLYKEAVLVCLWFIVGLWLYAYIAYSNWDSDLQLQGLVLVFALGVVLFVPAMVVLEGSRFWLLAITLSGSEESLMSHNHKLFKWIFSFLRNTQRVGGINVDPGFMEKHRLINRTIQSRKVKGGFVVSTDESFLMQKVTLNSSTYSYSAVRSAHNVSSHLKRFFANVLARGTDSRRASNLEPFVFWIGRFLFVFVVLPFTLLSSFASSAYPIVAFLSTTFGSIPLLQLVMSFAYFGLMLVWALFGLKAFQFLWMRAHLFDLHFLNSVSDWSFQNELMQRVTDIRAKQLVEELLPLPEVLTSIVLQYGFEDEMGHNFA